MENSKIYLIKENYDNQVTIENFFWKNI